MENNDLIRELQTLVNAQSEVLIATAKEIFANPEIAFTEHRAAKLLTELLKNAGFSVEMPYAQMDTAFRAEFKLGEGGATFALAAEYDALVGIGHACGHCLSGTASVGAAIAVKRYMEKHQLAGKIIVLGTPGEEGGGGKVLMLRNSECLKDVDAVMMAHATGGDTKVDSGSTGIHRYEVIYHGKASHAAGSPDKGINALDAQVLLFNAIGLYRQQMSRDGLIHGVILEGGEAANIIPDHTRSRFYIRSKKEEVIEAICERFGKMVEGAALMTGCSFEIKEYSLPYKARRPNGVLNKLFLDGAKALGTMNVSDAPAKGLGSSDFGDFSQVAPGAHPYFSICAPGNAEAPGHSELFKTYVNCDYGYARMLDAATVLALCVVEVLSDPELPKAIRAEFEK